ncbi:MAG: DUF192 domain-containing protein [Actinomycetota bacterium]
MASLEVAVGRVAKARGLLGRDHLDGALVIPGRRSVHSFSMGFELDVAFLDADGVVIRTLRLRRRRVTLPVWPARYIVEAEAGAFGEWELKVGDVLEIRLAGDEADAPEVADTGGDGGLPCDGPGRGAANGDGSGPGGA